MRHLGCIILAAGEGKRFKSKLPKPLHHLCGKPLIDHVLDCVSQLSCAPLVVVAAAGSTPMISHLQDRNVQTAIQDRRLGTGHAVGCAREQFADFDGPILVTCADVPLLRPQTMEALVEEHHRHGAAATLLTAVFDDPTGYGRIVRNDQGMVTAIVEHRDADEQIRRIHEINSGIYVFEGPALFEALNTLTPDNDQGEYYLTDVIARFVAQGQTVAALPAADPQEVLGVNTRAELARAEAIARDRIRARLMADGVTLLDPGSIFIDADVQIGRDTVIWPGAFILGNTIIGEDCQIGGHVFIENCQIGDGTRIRHCSVVRDSTVGRGVTIGPFAHVRDSSHIGDATRIGSFAEVVRTTLGQRCKDLHFSYLGDAVVGDEVNIGAGAVTCNYDGTRKHQTVIGEGAFVGSNSTIIAPLTIGPGAYLAGGSTINKDVPAEALAIGRARQENKEGYVRRLKRTNTGR